jgi:hypothetical protein
MTVCLNTHELYVVSLLYFYLSPLQAASKPLQCPYTTSNFEDLVLIIASDGGLDSHLALPHCESSTPSWLLPQKTHATRTYTQAYKLSSSTASNKNIVITISNLIYMQPWPHCILLRCNNIRVQVISHVLVKQLIKVTTFIYI